MGARSMIPVVLCALLPAIGSRAEARIWSEEDFGSLPMVEHVFALPSDGGRERTVIGESANYTPTEGDTLYDIGRYFGHGYNEMAAANPDIDPWIPAESDRTVVLPQQWVLPCCRYEGLVINIPEMRLYHYRPSVAGQARRVITRPVGLGRTEWRTPQGEFRVVEKTRDPTWVIPESIRQERIDENGSSERSIPGGSPENPLGRYRLRLSLPSYAIHGTNMPWGVGMSVSHGCIRMYPEDIERIFPQIPVGTVGEFVYETVKVGQREGRIWVEVHEDIYGLQPGRWRHAVDTLERAGLLERVDHDRLHKAVREMRGIPVDITGRFVPGGEEGFRPSPSNDIDEGPERS
jgi:L,D-transpeptidase ErfK/SrfK